MLDTANRHLDLAPPILTSLEIIEIAVERETLGLEKRLQAPGELEAVLAGVRDENARRVWAPHRRVSIPANPGGRK